MLISQRVRTFATQLTLTKTLEATSFMLDNETQHMDFTQV